MFDLRVETVIDDSTGIARVGGRSRPSNDVSRTFIIVDDIVCKFMYGRCLTDQVRHRCLEFIQSG